MTFSMPISIFDLIVKHAPCAIMIPKISCVFLGPTFPLENEAFWRLRGNHIFPKIRFRPNLGLHDFSKEKSEGPRPLLRWLRHFFSSTPFFGEILIVAILGQLGDWPRFVDLQDTHFGEVDLRPRFDLGLCVSR